MSTIRGEDHNLHLSDPFVEVIRRPVDRNRERCGNVIAVTPAPLVLTAALVATYAGVILLLQGRLGTVLGGDTLSVALSTLAVAAVVGVRHGESFSDFLDRIAARHAPGALAMIEHVLMLPKSGLVPIIRRLTVHRLEPSASVEAER